jgi:hypothetical protein
MDSGFFDISLTRSNQFYTWGWRASVMGAVITPKRVPVGASRYGYVESEIDAYLEAMVAARDPGRRRNRCPKFVK